MFFKVETYQQDFFIIIRSSVSLVLGEPEGGKIVCFLANISGKLESENEYRCGKYKIQAGNLTVGKNSFTRRATVLQYWWAYCGTSHAEMYSDPRYTGSPTNTGWTTVTMHRYLYEYFNASSTECLPWYFARGGGYLTTGLGTIQYTSKYIPEYVTFMIVAFLYYSLQQYLL